MNFQVQLHGSLVTSEYYIAQRLPLEKRAGLLEAALNHPDTVKVIEAAMLKELACRLESVARDHERAAEASMRRAHQNRDLSNRLVAPPKPSPTPRVL